ncbi:splicing factor 3A subunit 3-like [Watersipora subatra]|uniref:splicing factor 3A subunit 3-like n=1 Tax=Watersipora subatra TaxID=2589382 RepID=UPI00355B5E22
METILEQQRRIHEERERLTDAMVKETLHNAKSQRDQINKDTRLKLLLDRSTQDAAELLELYEDRDRQRLDEMQTIHGPNAFSEFYARLKNIRDFHRKHPNEISIPMSVEFEEIDKARETVDDKTILVDFTDEEGYGKYLDLHESYERFINLKGIPKMDYITYLTTFDKMFDIPKSTKNATYKEYILCLIFYLESYMSRIKPLLDLQEQTEKLKEEFDKQWEAGTFPGWPKETSGALAHTGAYLDLSAFSSAEELASLGLDRLKSALMALNLKCGGTLVERAQRLYNTKGKQIEDLDPAMFTRNKPGKSSKGKEADKQREIAELESWAYKLIDMLSEQRAATRDNIQRKQARTGEEREDSDDERAASDNSDDDDDDVPYNPKNLPLGWDGKPIPYWLYKLHGLNLYYSCEICGNQTYRGPKAFQRHFAEWRHAHGMRCLGIPNTAHFANVTSIKDAKTLWEKIKVNKESDRWKPDAEEEYEDSVGNVINKKVYEDLKRQDLL